MALWHRPDSASHSDGQSDNQRLQQPQILQLTGLMISSWFGWLIWQLFCYLTLSYKEAVLRYLLNSQLASLKITSLKKQANRSVHMGHARWKGVKSSTPVLSALLLLVKDWFGGKSNSLDKMSFMRGFFKFKLYWHLHWTWVEICLGIHMLIKTWFLPLLHPIWKLQWDKMQRQGAPRILPCGFIFPSLCFKKAERRQSMV